MSWLCRLGFVIGLMACSESAPSSTEISAGEFEAKAPQGSVAPKITTAIAVTGGEIWVGDDDGWLSRFSLTDATIRGSFPAHRSAVRKILTRGRDTVSFGAQGSWKRWSTDADSSRIRIPGRHINDARIGANHTTLVALDRGLIEKWSQRKRSWRIDEAHKRAVFAIALGTHHQSFFSVGGDHWLKRWHSDSGTMAQRWALGQENTWLTSVFINGAHVWVGDSRGKLSFLNTLKNEILDQVQLSTGRLIRIQNIGPNVAVGDTLGNIFIFEKEHRTLKKSHRIFSSPVLDFGSDGHRLFIAGDRGVVHMSGNYGISPPQKWSILGGTLK